MKIALRTPDIIRRMTDRFDLIAPTWSHTKRLTALAAMFGYHGWEDLVASCDSTAPLFIFDQDLLSDEARQQRWLAMAEQLAAALDLLLPTALIVVQRTLPTSQIGREMAAVVLFVPMEQMIGKSAIEIQHDLGLPWHMENSKPVWFDEMGL